MYQLSTLFYHSLLHQSEVCTVYLIMKQTFCLHLLQKVPSTWVEIEMSKHMLFRREQTENSRYCGYA